jgi:hypothetical protein
MKYEQLIAELLNKKFKVDIMHTDREVAAKTIYDILSNLPNVESEPVVDHTEEYISDCHKTVVIKYSDGSYDAYVARLKKSRLKKSRLKK